MFKLGYWYRLKKNKKHGFSNWGKCIKIKNFHYKYAIIICNKKINKCYEETFHNFEESKYNPDIKRKLRRILNGI